VPLAYFWVGVFSIMISFFLVFYGIYQAWVHVTPLSIRNPVLCC
jgi:hypothetical protein